MSALAMLMAAILCCWTPASIRAADDAAKATSPNAESEAADRWLPTSNWEVLFDESEGMTALEYARRLDYFGIELAAVAKNGQIQYASHLAERKPERRIGKLEEEPRINLHWKRGSLAALEAKLLGKAGINTKDKTLTHYYPKTVEARLARLEKSYAGRNPRDIQRTRFKVRAARQSAEGLRVLRRRAGCPGSRLAKLGEFSRPSGHPAAKIKASAVSSPRRAPGKTFTALVESHCVKKSLPPPATSHTLEFGNNPCLIT